MWSLIGAKRYSHSGSYQNLRASTPHQLERTHWGRGPGELNRQPGHPALKKARCVAAADLGAHGWVTLGLRVSRCQQPKGTGCWGRESQLTQLL